MKVTGFDPEITVEGAWRLPSSVRKANSVEELLKHADFVTLHLPLIAATRHLIDAKRLALMKPGAVLLNFARDAIVDDVAVVAALRAHRLKYYLCDFPSAALLGEPGVAALPHLGASTEEAEQNCAIMVVDQVREFLEHGTITNSVNFPDVEMQRESPYRVAIANANVPNMLGTDLDGDGRRRAEHSHHGEQVARRTGVHAGRYRQSDQPGGDQRHRGHRRRAVGADDSGGDPGVAVYSSLQVIACGREHGSRQRRPRAEGRRRKQR